MEALFLLLLVPVAVAALVYLSVAAYRRYKDNQLDGYVPIEGEDLIGDEWQGKIEEAAEKVLDEAKCNHQPDDRNYLPCTRKWDHDGPCAHAIKPSHKGNLVISMADANRQFDTFKKEELAKTGGPVKGSLYKYDDSYKFEEAVREANAHNAAHDRLKEWLSGKETRFLTGHQVCDPLAQIGRKVAPDAPNPNKPQSTDFKSREQVAILPNELVTFLGNNRLEVGDVISLAKKAIGLNEAEKAPYAEIIRKTAVEKALKIEREKYVAQLKDIEAKVKAEKEDDAFHLRVVSEEKARLEAEVSRLTAIVEAKAVKKPSKKKPSKKRPKRNLIHF